jgi:hypothetical protein
MSREPAGKDYRVQRVRNLEKTPDNIGREATGNNTRAADIIMITLSKSLNISKG